MNMLEQYNIDLVSFRLLGRGADAQLNVLFETLDTTHAQSDMTFTIDLMRVLNDKDQDMVIQEMIDRLNRKRDEIINTEHCTKCHSTSFEVQTMGFKDGDPDPNKRMCSNCDNYWWTDEFLKTKMTIVNPSEKKDDMNR